MSDEAGKYVWVSGDDYKPTAYGTCFLVTRDRYLEAPEPVAMWRCPVCNYGNAQPYEHGVQGVACAGSNQMQRGQWIPQ